MKLVIKIQQLQVNKYNNSSYIMSFQYIFILRVFNRKLRLKLNKQKLKELYTC